MLHKTHRSATQTARRLFDASGGVARSATRAILSLALALVAVVGAIGTSSSLAGAATTTPSTIGTTSSQGVQLSFTELGLSPSYIFAGGGSSVGVNLPVPQALVPSSMTGTMIIPPDFGGGTLVVLANSTTFVSSFQLPPNSSQQQVVSFSLSLVGVPLTGDSEAFTISVQQAGGGIPNVSTSGTCGKLRTAPS